MGRGATHSADARRWARRRFAFSGVAIQLAGAAMLAALCVTYPGATNAEASSGCTDFVIVGLRGAGAPYDPAENGMGYLPFRVANFIQAGLPVGTTMSMVGLPYEAPAFLGPPVILEDVLHIYVNRIAEGAGLLMSGQGSLTDLVAKCPQARIVLIGESLGAMVIDYALTVASQTGKADALFKHIRAILLFGDEFHLPNKPYDVGSPNAYGVLTKWVPQIRQGLGSDNAPAIPPSLYGEARSYCLTNDPLCDTSECCVAAGAVLEVWKLGGDTPHLHYLDQSPYPILGVNFALSKLTQDIAIDLKTSGDCKVAATMRSGTELIALTAPPVPQSSLIAIYNANNGAPLVQGETTNYEIDFERPVTNLVIGVKINGFTVATEYYQGPAAMRFSSNGDPYVVPALPPGVYGRIPYEVDVSGDAQCVANGTTWIPSPPGAKAVTVTAAVAAALFLILLAAFV